MSEDKSDDGSVKAVTRRGESCDVTLTRLYLMPCVFRPTAAAAAAAAAASFARQSEVQGAV